MTGNKSPLAKRAKTSSSVDLTVGELDSPEPEQPLEDIFSPELNGANRSAQVPSPEADNGSPVALKYSDASAASEPVEKEKKAKKEKQSQGVASRKRKATAKSVTSAAKRQATLTGFFK